MQQMSISIKKRLQPTYTYSPFPFKTLESFCFSDVSAYILSYLLFVPSLLLPIRKILVRQNSESQYEVESINDQSYLWKNGCYGNKRNSRDGPSLHLKLIEVVYLIILNVITVVDVHNSTISLKCLWSLTHHERFAAYWYYRSLGYTPKSGVLYGSDFVLYKQSPDFYHSEFAVIVQNGQNETWCDTQASVRTLAKVKKRLVVCKVRCNDASSLETESDLLNWLKSVVICDVTLKRYNPETERLK